ncbi:Enoyl-CoA hydratase, partial [hydrothermal vent metagenome]
MTDSQASASPEEPVLYERDGAVGVLTLNRPKAMNALTVPMLETMAAIIAGIEADPDTRVLVVTASGDKAFCVGADLKSRGKD